MKRLLFLLLLMPVAADAQTCTTAVCNAASNSESAFLAALPSSGNTNPTVVVNIPAGTASWTSDLAYTIPSAVTNLTIQGATTITWTGTAGQSSWNYSTNDQTIIRDADPSNNSLIAITTGSSTTQLRITGFTFQETTGATKYSGEINFGGSTHNLRFDHNHIGGTGKQDEWVRVLGPLTGVFDHNVVDENPTNTNGDNAFQAFNNVGDSIGLGDGSWLSGPQFGTLIPLYIESNYFKGGAPDDCNWGGRFVMRYNTFDSNYVPIQTHGTKSPGGPQRGCISYEAYSNYFIGSTLSPSSGATGAKGGTALVFNNTVASGYYRFFEASTDRNGGDNADEINTPNGFGYCGTSTPVPSTGNPNGVGAGWDGNNPSTTGYPCMDGLGRGQDTQALNGSVFPGRLNSVTGTIAWPHQYLEPIYMWNNNFSGANPGVTYTLVTTNASNNKDYYYDQSAQSGSFTGAAGTGHGLLSARPATCTAGPGGTYGTSPTGSYGVAYFATDANSGNGELYVCTSTNTWLGIYQSLIYPHPLVNPTPPPPTFPLSVTKAGTGGGTVTSSPAGISCGSTCSVNFNSGTSVTLTAAPDGSSTFAGWSGPCSGTGTCSVTVNSSISATAAFTANAPSPAPSFSPGGATYATAQSVSVTSTNPLIFYTTDGYTPNTASTPYSSPISIISTTTLQAISAAGGSVRRNTQALAVTNNSSGWKICTPNGGGPGTPTSVMCGGVGSTQPSNWLVQPGTTETISVSATSGAPQILVTLGGSGCDSCTELTMDKWIKPLDADTNVENHEHDAWHNDSTHNRLHMGGLQCNQQSAFLQWQVDNEQGSWQNTGITDKCPLSTSLWTHIVFHIHWIIGDTGCGGLGCTFYDYLDVCTASSPAAGCVLAHHVINKQLESDNPGWGAGCADQDQVDLRPNGTYPKTGGVLVQANNVTCAFGVSSVTSAIYNISAVLNPVVNFTGAISITGQIHVH